MIESTMQFQELALTAFKRSRHIIRRQFVRGEIPFDVWQAKAKRLEVAYEKRAERITRIGVE